MGITGKIYGINGPVITIQGNLGYKMNEMVYVGEHRLVGEVIRLSKEKTTIRKDRRKKRSIYPDRCTGRCVRPGKTLGDTYHRADR